MGQVSERMIEMFERLLESGQHINSTHSEEAQLVRTWRLHQSAKLRIDELEAELATTRKQLAEAQALNKELIGEHYNVVESLKRQTWSGKPLYSMQEQASASAKWHDAVAKAGTDALSAAIAEAVAPLTGLLSEASYHLKEHARDYHHPGQPALIDAIDAAIKGHDK